MELEQKLFSGLGPSGNDRIIRDGILTTARLAKDDGSEFSKRVDELLKIADNDELLNQLMVRGYDSLLFFQGTEMVGYAGWQRCGVVYNLFSLFVKPELRCKHLCTEFVRRFLMHVYAQSGENGSAIIGAGTHVQVTHICLRARSNDLDLPFDTYPGRITDMKSAVGFRTRVPKPFASESQAV